MSEHMMEHMGDAARAQVGGFRQFVEDQNVVGIAVGLAVGSAASALATSFINNIVMVPVGFIFGSPDGLNGLGLNLGVKNGVMVTWPIGAFLASLVNFLVVAFTFYLVIKCFGLDKKKKKA